MSNVLAEFRHLLNDPSNPPRKGEVVEVRSASILVKTYRGVNEYAVTSSYQYRVGDLVRLQDGIVLGKNVPPKDLQSYQV